MTRNRGYSGVVLVRTDGKLLLQRRDDKPGIVNPGRVTLFGGVAENGESPHDCAIRELREELELVVEGSQLKSLGTIIKQEIDGTTTKCTLFVLHLQHNAELAQHEGAGFYIAEAADAAVSEVTLFAIRKFQAQRGSN